MSAAKEAAAAVERAAKLQLERLPEHQQQLLQALVEGIVEIWVICETTVPKGFYLVFGFLMLLVSYRPLLC